MNSNYTQYEHIMQVKKGNIKLDKISYLYFIFINKDQISQFIKPGKAQTHGTAY